MLHHGEQACITYGPAAPIGVSLGGPREWVRCCTGRVGGEGYLVDEQVVGPEWEVVRGLTWACTDGGGRICGRLDYLGMLHADDGH